MTCSYQACLEIRFEPPKLTERQQGWEIIEIYRNNCDIFRDPYGAMLVLGEDCMAMTLSSGDRSVADVLGKESKWQDAKAGAKKHGLARGHSAAIASMVKAYSNSLGRFGVRPILDTTQCIDPRVRDCQGIFGIHHPVTT